MSFTPYEDSGAYHWVKLAGQGPRGYHARLHARYRWFVDATARRCPRLVIDIGCGDGALTHLLTFTDAQRVVGVEPEPSGVEAAHASLAAVASLAEVVPGSGAALPFISGSVGVAVLCEVIEHVGEPDALIREAARVLAPDGTLLLSTPQAQAARPSNPFHIREFRPSELTELLRQSFEEVHVHVSEPGWLVAAYTKRPGRLITNALSLAGLNPFRLLRPPSPRRAGWLGLYATATRPRPTGGGAQG